MGSEGRFAPLYIGYDDGNEKYDPVLSVFKRREDGGYILVKNFSGSDAMDMYTLLTDGVRKEAN